MTNTKHAIVYSAVTSIFVCTLFLGFNYLQAQWSGAPSNPPSGNIAAPIHTGGGNQMSAAGPVPVGGDTPDRISTGQFLASDRMLSDRYCDVRGENCFEPGDAGAGTSCPSRTFSFRGTGDIHGTCDYNLPPGIPAEVNFKRDADNHVNGTHPRTFQCQDGRWELVQGNNTCNWNFSGFY